ncbi:hypothetical protein BGZ97_010592, partial [Linnemannia gamsii]
HPLSESNPELERALVKLSDQILGAYLIITSATGSVPAFEPVLYATQVVAGANYYVKMMVLPGGNSGGDSDYVLPKFIHVKIFDQSWTKTIELTGISVNMTFQDPFEYDMPAPPSPQ